MMGHYVAVCCHCQYYYEILEKKHNTNRRQCTTSHCKVCIPELTTGHICWHQVIIIPLQAH